MCGIVGFNWEDKKLVKAMADKMIHRGPDDKGYFTDKNISLGSRRLSIIDLSRAGRMPLSNEKEDAWITFNGEIYNFKEIRKELKKKGYKFKSDSDTEVIVNAYREYGEKCVNKFNGQFAFCIWDAKEKKMFLARDRLGIKPLYYYWDENKFIFASEMGAILLHDIPREIKIELMKEYLYEGYTQGPNTLVKNVYRLLPGHTITLKSKKIKISKFWDVDFSKKIVKPESYYIKKIDQLLKQSVKRRMISDVPLGAFLSGGLDSTTITSYMSKLSSDPIQTFSIGFSHERGETELPQAQEVAEMYGTDHHEKIVDATSLGILPKIIDNFGEPFGAYSMIPVYEVAKFAREKVTVALSGDGGDELFAGYKRYVTYNKLDNYMMLPKHFRKLISQGRHLVPKIPGSNTGEKIKHIAKKSGEDRRLFYLTNPEMCKITEREQQKLLNKKTWNKTKNHKLYYEKFLNSDLDYRDMMMRADLKVYIPEQILSKSDRTTMMVSLEDRTPMLDHELVEFTAKIPASVKLRNNTKKYLLKKLMKDKLPASVLKKKKTGFSSPLEKWFKDEETFAKISNLLTEKRSSRGIFNSEYTRKLLTEQKKGVDTHSSRIGILLSYEIWNRIYIDNENPKKIFL